MGETKNQLDMCHPVKPPAPGIGYIKLSHWPKVPMKTPKYIKLLENLLFALCKLKVRLLLKTNFIYFTEHREIKLFLLEASSLLISVYGT